jgi:hypothetical protein
VPMKPTLTPVNAPKGIECFDVEIPCAPPRPVSGYFARPAQAAPKSLPAILMVQRAGVFGNSPKDPIGYAPPSDTPRGLFPISLISTGTKTGEGSVATESRSISWECTCASRGQWSSSPPNRSGTVRP